MIDSSIVVLAYLCATAVLKRRYLVNIVRMLQTTYCRNLAVLFAAAGCWMVFVILLNHTGDFDFVVTFIHVFIQTVTGILLFTYFRINNCQEKIVDCLIRSIVIQTVIQWAGFLNPTVRVLIQSTKSETAITRAALYQGVRGFSLSGNEFFGVSAAYALILLLYWSKKNTIFRNNSALKLALYLFILSGVFFSGRTGYIGLGFALLYLALWLLSRGAVSRRRRGQRLIMNTLSFFAAGAGVVGIVSYLYGQFRSNRLYYKLFRFTFGPIFKKLESNTFMIASVDNLINNMYFRVPLATFFIGDGRYRGDDGRAYMHTDAGYMRMILFMGLFGFLLLLALQVFMIGPRRGGEKKLKLIVLGLLMVLNIKGEIISCELVVLSIGLLFYLQDLFPPIPSPEGKKRLRRTNSYGKCYNNNLQAGSAILGARDRKRLRPDPLRVGDHRRGRQPSGL
jgi:hypothetical protein